MKWDLSEISRLAYTVNTLQQSWFLVTFILYRTHCYAELLCLYFQYGAHFYSQGNKCRFCQIFVEALKEFPNLFIQSETSASTPKAIAPANTSCCLATSETNTAGSVMSRRRDFAINGSLFPLLFNLSHSMYNNKLNHLISYLLSLHWLFYIIIYKNNH